MSTNELLNATSFWCLLDLLIELSENGKISIFTCGDGDEVALKETAGIQGIAYPLCLEGFMDVRNILEKLGILVDSYQSGTIYRA